MCGGALDFIERQRGMRIRRAGAHFRGDPDRFHDLLRSRTGAPSRLSVAHLGNVAWSGVSTVLLWIGVAFAIPAMLAGLLDFASLPRAVQDSRELTSHILCMAVAFICFLGVALLRTRSSSFGAPAVWYVVAIESIGAMFLVYGGHLASIIVFERLRTAPLDSESGQSRP